MKNLLIILPLMVCSSLFAQNTAQTGFATKGSNVIYFGAGIYPSNGEIGHNAFFTNYLNIGLSLNFGTAEWYHADNNNHLEYYNRSYVQPGLKMELHFFKHAYVDAYMGAGMHIPIFTTKAKGLEDSYLEASPDVYSVFLGSRLWVSKRVGLYLEAGYGTAVFKGGLNFKIY